MRMTADYWSDKRNGRPDYRIRSARARESRARKVQFLYSLIAAGMVLIILAGCFLHMGFSSQADETGSDAQKLYTSVLITYEQTAESYAEKYADPAYYRNETEYLREVCRINHLTMHNGEIQGLMPGNYIIVPYYAEVITASLQ